MLKCLQIILLFSLIHAEVAVAENAAADAISSWIEEQQKSETKFSRMIGQILLVGIDSDYKNIKERELDELFMEVSPGGIFLNRYNFYDGEQRFKFDPGYTVKRSTGYTGMLIEKSKTRDSYIPVYLAVDYEGPLFDETRNVGNSLLHTGLVPPPPALTLAATGNGDMIRATGRKVGAQLRTINVSMLLGPVIDLDSGGSRLNGNDRKISDVREFGSNPEGVYNAATHYITGVREAEVAVIAKHFPGLGMVSGNLHKRRGVGEDFPTLYVTEKSIQESWRPFASLSSKVDGIMTSHVKVSYRDMDQKSMMTFSTELVKKVLRAQSSESRFGFNMRDRLVMTDDLSSMGPVLDYADEVRGGGKKRYGYAQIGFEAFKAGHDIILFSHPKGKGIQSTGYEITDLLELKTLIQGEALNDAGFMGQLKESIMRILLFKCDGWIRNGHSVEQCLTGHVDVDGGKDKVFPQASTEVLNFDIYSLYEKIHDSSFMELNLVNEKALKPFELVGNLDIFVPERVVEQFKLRLEPQGRWKVHALKQAYSRAEKDAAQREFREVVNHSDYVAILPDRIEHYDFIDHVAIHDRAKLKNIIVILHDNPKNIPYTTAQHVNIFGNFSGHEMAYRSTLKFLSGGLSPQPSSNIPLQFLDVGETRRVIESPAEGFERMRMPSTQEAILLAEENEKLKKELASSSFVNGGVSSWWLFVLYMSCQVLMSIFLASWVQRRFDVSIVRSTRVLEYPQKVTFKWILEHANARDVWLLAVAVFSAGLVVGRLWAEIS